MQSRPLILIVEDEVDLARAIARGFEHAGFATHCAASGAEAREFVLGREPPDAILLDLMLPDLSGIELLRAIRQNEATHSTPVVFLTAQDSEVDRVRAFELGADDYVLKPFSLRELTLRMRALLRRTWAPENPVEPVEEKPTPEEKRTRGARLDIDFDGYRVCVDGEEIAVTALEFRLLRTLATRPGRVQTRSRLLQDVWGMDGDLSTRTVDTHVRRLRVKLGPAAVYVETIRGVGYRFLRDPS